MMLPIILSRRSNNLIKINSQNSLDAINFQANKTYLFETNKEFYVNKNINQSNITIGAYGTGNKPVLRGSNYVQDESWTNEGSGVYSLITSEVKWLYIDGYEAILANHGTWIPVTLPTDLTKFNVTASLLTGIETVGAYVVCRNTPWSFTRGNLVINYSNGLFTIARARGYYDRTWNAGIQAGVTQKINLYGLASYIKNDYDWAYQNGKLYIKLPLAPSNYVIRAVKWDSAFNVSASNITIKDLEIKDYFRAGIITDENSDLCKIDNCEIHNIREDGIRLLRKNNGTEILNSEIYDCDVRGIYSSWHKNLNIHHNTIYNISLSHNIGWLKDALDTTHYCLMAITCAGVPAPTPVEGLDGDYAEGLKINDNLIHDIGYSGLHVAKANGEIKRNVIHDFNIKMEDGGGIYTCWGLWDYDLNGSIYGLEIAYNHVYGIYESNWGKANIYQDNGSGANNVHHNVLYDYKGTNTIGPLYINTGSAFQRIEDNIVMCKNGSALRHMYADNGAHGIVAQDCHINRNIFITIDNAPESLLRVDGNVYATLGSGDNNYFISPYAANKVAYNNRSLFSWQSVYGKDLNSRVKENWLTYVDEATAENDVKLYTNETSVDYDVVIPSGYEDIDGIDRSGQTMTVPAHYGLVLLKSNN